MSEPIQVAPPPDPVGDDAIPTPPCKIYLKDGSTFHVRDVDAWTWQDNGIFATGTWVPDSRWTDVGERDILFPLDSVHYIEYDFAALQKWMEEQRV